MTRLTEQSSAGIKESKLLFPDHGGSHAPVAKTTRNSELLAGDALRAIAAAAQAS
jgi:hypothetical protein